MSPSIRNPNNCYGIPENYNSLGLCKVVKKMEFIVTELLSPLYMKRVAIIGAQLLLEYLVFARNSEACVGVLKTQGHFKL